MELDNNNWNKKLPLINYNTMYFTFFEAFVAKLNLSLYFTTYTINEIHDDITDENLEEAANLFLYMTAPYQKYWILIWDLYSNWLEILSPRRIIGLSILKSLQVFFILLSSVKLSFVLPARN